MFRFLSSSLSQMWVGRSAKKKINIRLSERNINKLINKYLNEILSSRDCHFIYLNLEIPEKRESTMKSETFFLFFEKIETGDGRRNISWDGLSQELNKRVYVRISVAFQNQNV